MPLDVGSLVSVFQAAIDAIRSDQFRQVFAERQELRNALRDLAFSEETLARLALPQDDPSRRYLAIRMRDTNQRVSKALDIIVNFSASERVSLQIQQAIDFIKWNKIDIRIAISDELHGKPQVGLLEKIRELNQAIVEVDRQVGGAVL